MTCQEFPMYENIFKLLFMGKKTHYVKTIFCMFRIKSFISITSFLKYYTKRCDNVNEALIHNSLVRLYNLVFIVRKLECYCEFCENKNLKKKTSVKMWIFLVQDMKVSFFEKIKWIHRDNIKNEDREFWTNNSTKCMLNENL